MSGTGFFFSILAQMRNEHRDCDQLSAAAAAAAAAAVGTPGCGTFTAQTRVGNAARAIKNVVIPPPPHPPLRPPYCSRGLYDISQAAGVRVHH